MGIDGGDDHISLGGSWEEEVCFRARGNANGFAPNGCFLNQDRVAFRVKFACLKEELHSSLVMPGKKKAPAGDSGERDMVASRPFSSSSSLGKLSNFVPLAVSGAGPYFKEISREDNLGVGPSSSVGPFSLGVGHCVVCLRLEGISSARLVFGPSSSKPVEVIRRSCDFGSGPGADGVKIPSVSNRCGPVCSGSNYTLGGSVLDNDFGADPSSYDPSLASLSEDDSFLS